MPLNDVFTATESPAPHCLKAALMGASILALALVGNGLSVASAPAMTVYDPANYSQNVLQAARMLEQIRIQTEQLAAQVKSLAASPYDHSPEIKAAIGAMDELAAQAKGLKATVSGLDRQFDALYPGKTNAKTGVSSIEASAARIEASRQTARDLADTAARLEGDRAGRVTRLGGVLRAAQSAQGETGVLQSSVQALGVLSEQLEGVQALLAAQGRLAASEAASRAAERSDALASRQRAWGRTNGAPSAPAFNPLPNARR